MATPRKVMNDLAKMLWEIQTDKLVMANSPDLAVMNKQKKVAVIDVAVLSDSCIMVNKHEELDKYQGL